MAFDVPDPLKALREWLLADVDIAAAVGTRVYLLELPKEETVNMEQGVIVLKESSGPMPRVGCARLGSPPIEVWCYGISYGAARTLAMGVYQKLKFLSRVTAANTLIHSVVPFGGRVSMRDPDTKWPFTMQSFQLTAAETAIP